MDDTVVRNGIFWVLPSPHPFAGLSDIVAWLDHRAAEQATIGLAQTAERIAFGRPGGVPLFVLKGGRSGSFSLGDNQVQLEDPATGLLEYVLDLDRSMLSASPTGLVFTRQGSGHVFGRRRALDTSRSPFAIMQLGLDLTDASAIGCFRGEGHLSSSNDILTPTSIDEIVGAGLVNRFTYLKGNDGSPGTSVEEAAVLHGGEAGTRSGRCVLSLDPFAPLDQQRSFLQPLPRSDTEALVLAIPTSPGHDVEVVPQPTPALQRGPVFVFTRHPLKLQGGADDYDDTMSLRGTFKANVKSPAEGAEAGVALDLAILGLLPGFAPSEALGPSASGTEAAGDVFVTFDLGPAIDKRSPEGFAEAAESTGAANTPALSAQGYRLGVTSWMSVHRGDLSGTMRMIAEPPSGRNLKMAGSVLEHAPLELTVGRQNSANIPAGFVPVLPPRGVQQDQRKSARAFDIERLAHERRKLATPKGYAVTESSPATEADPVISRSTTPLGFEVERLPDGRIAAIVFAVSVGSIDGQPAQFQFAVRGRTPGGAKGPVLPAVADALIRNRLFLVANKMPDAAAQGTTSLESRVAIGGWPFDVGIPGAEGRKEGQKLRSETLFIVKGYEGRSIVELADDPPSWSGRDQFLRPGTAGKGDPTANARQHLKAFIGRAKTEANASGSAAAKQYQLLLSILNDGNWAGVLIINCDLGLGDLPAQVQGLLGGMDLERLRGEYVAIELKGIGSSGGSTKSRLSGLIDYRDDDSAIEPAKANAAEPEHDGSYGFKIRRLLVSFANGEISTFQAKIDFYLGRLFHGFGDIWEKRGSTAWQRKGDSILSLVGRYERVREGGATREIYTYETDPEQNFRYAAKKDGQVAPEEGDKDAIIRIVDVNRIAYVTDASTPDGADAKSVVSRFLLDGRVKFGSLGGLDVIDIEALDFSDMGIATGFRIPNLPGHDIERALRMFFNPGRLRFQFGSATKRPGRGFWSSFPLKFKALNLFGKGLRLPDLGYFGLGSSAAADGFRFGLEFDLDLGFLGSLAPKKGFKLSVLFGFSDGVRTGGGWAPCWALGIKFPESDGKLDIGIEGVIKLRAERFKILDKQFRPPGGGAPSQIKLLYAIGAQLEILGYQFPKDAAGISLFLFVDPKALGSGQASSGIGWFAARKPIDGKIGVFDLKAIALGQRVDPLPAALPPPKTTKEVVDRFTALTSKAPYDHDTGNDETAALDKISTAIERDYIRFDPARGWSVGFSAVFADRVELGLAMRDDDIYGIRLGVTLSPGSSDYLFSLDVLYRKLSEKLGVYSIEIVAPPAWRQLEFGVVSVTLPAIAFEIYTDGGFTVDLGYPFNKDYGRAFGVQVFPFIGSGGLYFRRVSGPAAWLIPQPRFHDGGGSGALIVDAGVLTYKPVIEVGMAFRVGLGKEINKGIFRAGLSVTVFAEIEGGYGVLWHDPARPEVRQWTQAASTFVAIRGQVGILGEIYGYVDFGIVKAGVSIRVWVAYGFDMKTDHRIRLYIEAGVSVRISVVIARFRVLGKTIEISLHFRFSTTVDYSVYVGSDRNTQYYLFQPRAVTESIVVTEAGRRLLVFKEPPAWTENINPADWRLAPDLGPWRMPVYLMPDMTLAAAADASVRANAVFLGVIPDSTADGHAVGGSSLAVLMAAWTIANTTNRSPGVALRDHEITFDTLDRISLWVAAGDTIIEGTAHASERRKRQPSFPFADALFRANVDATISRAPDAVDGDAPIGGVFFPLPPTATITRSGFAESEWPVTTRLADKQVVNDSYREKIDAELQRQMAALASSRANESLGAEAEPQRLPIAQVLFEDYVGLIIRGSVARLCAIAAEKIKDAAPRADGLPHALRLGDLLDELERDEVRSGVLAMATRLFLHGPRLPDPDSPPAGVMPPNIASGTHHGLYQLAWLQHPLGHPAAPAERPAFVVETGDSFLRGGTLTFAIDGVESDALAQFAAGAHLFTDLGGRISAAERFRTVPRDFAVGRPRVLGGSRAHLVPFPAEVIRHQAKASSEGLVSRPGLRAFRIGERTRPEAAAKIGSHAVIAVTLRLQLVKPALGAAALDRFEIAGMPEGDRVWLDALNLEAGGAQRIARAEFYNVKPDGLEPLVAAATSAVVVQSDLSAEARPFGATELAAEASVSETYVASIDELQAFVEIVRRAGVTNRAGTSIGWPAAGSSIQQLPPRPEGDGSTPPIELMMILYLTDESAGYANAVVFDVPADQADPAAYLDGHSFTFQIHSDNPLARAELSEPVAPAGVLPIIVTRPERPAVPTGLNKELWDQFAARFSMFAYSVRDESGELVSISESLAVGHTDDEGVSEELTYRLALPFAKLMNSRSPYADVGKTLQLAGQWRDVYGNDWSGPPLASVPIKIRYSDRLIPLNDLPGLLLAWWPGSTAGRLNVAILLDPRSASSIVPDGESPLTDDQYRALIEMSDRARVIYAQAALQLRDEHIGVSLTDGGGSEQTRALKRSVAFARADVEKLWKFIEAAGAALGAIANVRDLRTIPATRVRTEAEGLLSRDPVVFGFDVELSGGEFAELALALRVERTSQDGLDGTEPSDVKSAVVPLPLPLRHDGSAKPANTVAFPAGFGRTLEELEDSMARFAPQFLVATGYGSVPGLVERAIWLVRQDVLPPANHFTTAVRHDLALPPISTSLHSFVADVPTFRDEKPVRSVGFDRIDADATAARALTLYDEVLDVPAVQRLADTRGGRDALQQILVAKASIAASLVADLRPVLDGRPTIANVPSAILKDRVLARLSAADAIDTISYYEDQAAVPHDEEKRPQAYGSIVSRDTGVVPYTMRPSAMQIGAPASGRRHLFVTTDVTPNYDNNTVRSPAGYRLTHVQRLPRPALEAVVPGDPGRYRPTAWLKLATPWVYELPDADIPIVRKRYPRTPAIEVESIRESMANTIGDARLWKHSRTWSYEGSGSDRLKLTLRYNPGTGPLPAEALPGPSRDTLRAMAFAIFAEAVEPVLRQLGREATGEAAARFLAARTQDLASALSQRIIESEAALVERLDVYDVAEEVMADGRRRLTIKRDKSRAGLPGPGGFELYCPADAAHPKTDDVGPLIFDEGDLAKRLRRLDASDLDILAYRSAQTELDLTRNAEIRGKPVAKEFVYRVPTVASGAPLMPILTVAEVEMTSQACSFGEHFAAMLKDLLGPRGGSASDHDAILEELSLDVLLTFEPLLAEEVDIKGDGLHVSGLARSGLRTGDWTGWVGPFVESVAAWRRSYRPAAGGNYVFDFRVFETASNRPIIRIRRCVLPAKLISG
ncbi:hypothetical protein A6X20_16780 [Bradyrhizobium elkanii]|nr:hypothetical protein A6452_38985 [Bradyrhizobium elkanii]ODM82775.1 hypothetical protein A6X20_16780 [Bradyrhizobium elkanii]